MICCAARYRIATKTQQSCTHRGQLALCDERPPAGTGVIRLAAAAAAASTPASAATAAAALATTPKDAATACRWVATLLGAACCRHAQSAVAL